MRIALTLDRDSDTSESNDYLQSLLEAGVPRDSIEIVTPLSANPPAAFDALVLGGGADVDPARYGREPLGNGTLEVDAERDRIDFELFDLARRRGAPVLGICRGLQVVNVALGGTLVQDIPTERPSDVVHERKKDKLRRDHAVAVEPGTWLAELSGGEEVLVNSRHHQAIEAVAPGLAVSGTSPDGLAEAVEAVEAEAGPWLVAVQWHPENLAPAGDPVSRRLFAGFAEAARRAASRR